MTWPASEAELLDIARDDGMEDPGSEPHIPPEIHCDIETSGVTLLRYIVMTHIVI